MEKTRVCNDVNKHMKCVTIKSAHKAAYELSRKIAAKRIKEVEKERLQLGEKLVKDYIPFAIISDELKGKLYAKEHVEIKIDECGETRYQEAVLPFEILPVTESIVVSLEMFLAYEALEKRVETLREAQNKMCDSIFEELVRMNSKDIIEQMFPEAVPYLEFDDFCSNIEFIRDVIRKEI